MSRRRLHSRTSILLLILGLWTGGVSLAATGESPKLLRLREATSLYPDDPDIAWAFAEALSRARHPEAEQRLRDFQDRWPERRPESGVHLGRILYERGEFEEALRSLDAALARRSAQAYGHLYRGLALWKLGRIDEADAALERAGRTSPTLREPVARLRERIKPSPRAARSGAPTASERVAIGELEPRPDRERGEHGEQERSIIADRAPSRMPIRTFFGGGFEWDSNPE